jgi:hypothetical protein
MKAGSSLIRQAQAAKKKLDRKRSDPRFKKVIGKLIHAGLLTHNKLGAFGGPVAIEDALWVGEVEPRVLELLPAILLKRPVLFYATGPLPEDLRQILIELRRGQAVTPFRGVSVQGYAAWLDKVGRKGSGPTLLKTYRFQQEDLALLEELRRRTQKAEIEIIREGLRALASR